MAEWNVVLMFVLNHDMTGDGNNNYLPLCRPTLAQQKTDGLEFLCTLIASRDRGKMRDRREKKTKMVERMLRNNSY